MNWVQVLLIFRCKIPVSSLHGFWVRSAIHYQDAGANIPNVMYSNLSCELKGQAAGIQTDSGRFVLTSDCPKTEMRDAINLCGDSLQFCVNVQTLLDGRWDTWTSAYGCMRTGTGTAANSLYLYIIFSYKTPSG